MQLGYNSDPFHRIAQSLYRGDTQPPVEWTHYMSSLQAYCVCNHCLTKFDTKRSLISHLAICGTKPIQCEICHIKFRNKGNLAYHAKNVHNEGKYSKPERVFKCAVCEKKFSQYWKLMIHVRQTYFNLSPEPCTRPARPVNDVWVEKVLNSDTLIEMKKIKKNVIIMKKCQAASATVVKETEVNDACVNDQPVDVFQKPKVAARVMCSFCNKWLMKRSLGKHITEKHVNAKVHKCSKCDFKTNRPYLLLRHTCTEKATKLRATKRENLLKQQVCTS